MSRDASPREAILPLAAATGAILPWLLIRALGLAGPLGPAVTVPVSGLAVLGSAFLVTWGAETAEVDVPRSLALAVLAIVAVAPEYAVDALYAWEAGAAPGTPASEAASDLAVANMTGANRLLIGLGWAGIGLYALARARRAGDPAVDRRDGLLADAVRLDPRIAVELSFLLAATLYAFLVPLDGGINAVDGLVLVGIYATYVTVIIRGDVGSSAHSGVPAHLQALPRRLRRLAVVLLFGVAALALVASVKPFAKGLEALGPMVGLSAFFMVQWVAPLASESPEFIATGVLVRKGRTTSAFTTLISSKLNQWTLLIGTLVAVYSLSLGRYGPLGFSPRQAGEIWITAAQSLFAVALLVNLELTGREAVALLALFVAQFHPVFQTYEGLLAYSALYGVLALGLLVRRRLELVSVLARARQAVAGEDPGEGLEAPGPGDGPP